MSTALRRLRGLLGTGLTWGVGWAVVGAVIWTVTRVLDPGSIDQGEGILPISGILGTVGFVSGIAFGVLLSLSESRKRILELSLARAAVWGIAGAAVFPLLTGRYDQVFVMCPIGALFASGSVALARRAERRELAQPAGSKQLGP